MSVWFSAGSIKKYQRYWTFHTFQILHKIWNVFHCLNHSRQNFVLANCYLSPAVSFSTLSLHSWFCKSFSYNLFLTILFHILSMKVLLSQIMALFFWLVFFDWFLESPKIFSLFEHFHFNRFGHYSRHNCFFMSSSH